MAPSVEAQAPFAKWAMNPLPGVSSVGGNASGLPPDCLHSEVERWLTTPSDNTAAGTTGLEPALERPPVPPLSQPSASPFFDPCLFSGLDASAAGCAAVVGHAAAVTDPAVNAMASGMSAAAGTGFHSLELLMDVHGDSMAFHDEECYDAMSSVPDTVQSHEDGHDVHHADLDMIDEGDGVADFGSEEKLGMNDEVDVPGDAFAPEPADSSQHEQQSNPPGLSASPFQHPTSAMGLPMSTTPVTDVEMTTTPSPIAATPPPPPPPPPPPLLPPVTSPADTTPAVSPPSEPAKLTLNRRHSRRSIESDTEEHSSGRPATHVAGKAVPSAASFSAEVPAPNSAPTLIVTPRQRAPRNNGPSKSIAVSAAAAAAAAAAASMVASTGKPKLVRRVPPSSSTAPSPAPKSAKSDISRASRPRAGGKKYRTSSAPVSVAVSGRGSPASSAVTVSPPTSVAAAAAAAAASITARANMSHLGGSPAASSSGSVSKGKVKTKPSRRKRSTAGDANPSSGSSLVNGSRTGGAGSSYGAGGSIGNPSANKARKRSTGGGEGGEGKNRRRSSAIGTSGSHNAGGETDDKNVPVKERCIKCGTSAKNTPMMRKGPDGCRSMCNACGLRWARHGVC